MKATLLASLLSIFLSATSRPSSGLPEPGQRVELDGHAGYIVKNMEKTFAKLRDEFRSAKEIKDKTKTKRAESILKQASPYEACFTKLKGAMLDFKAGRDQVGFMKYRTALTHMSRLRPPFTPDLSYSVYSQLLAVHAAARSMLPAEFEEQVDAMLEKASPISLAGYANLAKEIKLETWATISAKAVRIGMTGEEVSLALGGPLYKGTSEGTNPKSEYWRYEHGVIVRFQDGKVFRVDK